MLTQISRRYHFESAHFLPNVHDGHKCKRVHGHNYEIEVTYEGPMQQTGFLIDFWDLDKIVKPIIERIDHRCLNDIPGLENPTAENIGAWLLATFRESDDGIIAVRVYETKDCWADVKIGLSYNARHVVDVL